MFSFAKKDVGFGYDQAGNLSSITYPDATVYNVGSDYNGRILSIAEGATQKVAYQYIGQRVAKRSYTAPAVDVEYVPSYDNFGRLSVAHTYQSTTDIVEFSYTYDDPNTDNITRMSYDHRSGGPDVDFSYDNLDRLTLVDYGIDDTNEVFTMDDLGNRDVVAVRSGDDEDYIIDANTNRYASIDSNDLTYDVAGNLTKDKDGYLYNYDYENRLSSVTRSDLSPVASYAYDAMGRRISMYDFSTNPAEVTFYYHNAGWQVLAEYDYNWSTNQQDFARRFR